MRVMRAVTAMLGGCSGRRAARRTALATAQDAQEGALEVATGARVDDGIHHAVAVAEPEHDLEQRRRNAAAAAQCFCTVQAQRALLQVNKSATD